jgi:hypothetical protein
MPLKVDSTSRNEYAGWKPILFKKYQNLAIRIPGAAFARRPVFL